MTALPDSSVPLTPLDLSILLVLSEGPSYGYGIMKAVGEQTNGGIELAPGNIYQALDRLISRAWIAETEPPPGTATRERRRYYGITAEGTRAAAAEATRLQQMQAALRRVQRLRTSEG